MNWSHSILQLALVWLVSSALFSGYFALVWGIGLLRRHRQLALPVRFVPLPPDTPRGTPLIVPYTAFTRYREAPNGHRGAGERLLAHLEKVT